MIGESVRRREDERFLTGQGRYVDDVNLPGMVYMAVVRSPHAHANVKRIDASAATKLSGVIGVFSGTSFPEFDTSLPVFWETKHPYSSHGFKPVPHPVFPPHITYIGEQVAVVVADTPYAAVDGADAVEVDYEVLPALTDWEAAMAPEAPPIHAGFSNRIGHLTHEIGDIEEVLAKSEVIISKRFDTASLRGIQIEGRGVAAQWDTSTSSMLIWSTTQLPYVLRDKIGQMLSIPYDNVRIIARDIGGGFGLKGAVYPEDLIAAVLARHLKRPVKWQETRLEHFLASNQSGRQTHIVRAGFDRNGILKALDLTAFKELGAYAHVEMMLMMNTINHLSLHYHVPNLRVEAYGVLTNTSCGTPYRGAGRVEAVLTIERLLDAISKELNLDPAEVRRRNLITKEEMPYRPGLIYRDGVPVTYDNLDFPLLFEAALKQADYDGWRTRQQELREKGRLIGIGIASYVEGGGIGPCEGATVTIEDTGRVTVKIGVNSQGQSHETTLAQVCAAMLGVSLDRIDVLGGDTTVQRYGFGTGASRVAINTGSAVHNASKVVRKKIVALAAALFDCGEDDLVIKDGVVSFGESQTTKRQEFISVAELSLISKRSLVMANHGGPGLQSTEFFYPKTVIWSSGVNVAVVEIDRDTGKVKFHKYVFVHDSGNPIHPAVVEGQLSGGFAQGFGMVMGEAVRYARDGQCLTATLQEYYVPRAGDIPAVDYTHFCIPTNDNPLGIKSVGESGPNAPPSAIAAAIEDALQHRIELNALPVQWSEILKGLSILKRGSA